MAMFKLVKKKNPLKPEEAAKWHAVCNSSQPLSGRAMVKEATANTTIGPTEMQAALDLLSDFIPKQLKQGHTVNVPGLGTFRLSFKSEGVTNIDDFKADVMVKNKRVVFTPCKELREAVLQDLTFENNGVIENGTTYASLKEYRKAKAQQNPTE